jgi:outer membrane protein assembly factor BamB
LYLGGIPVAQALDWPGFRGPAADGIAEQEKAPAHFNPTSNLVWKAEIPAGHSSPVVWKGRIFLTGSEGNTLSAFCLDGGSGKQLWERRMAVEKLEAVHQANSHASPTPVTDGQRLCVYFPSFGLLAYDLAGKELWRRPLPLPKTFYNQGSGSSPILAGGKLLVFVQLGNDSHLLAVNPADGEVIWKAPLPIYNVSYATPVA